MLANMGGGGGQGMEMMGLMSMFSMLGRSDQSQARSQNDSTLNGQSASPLHDTHGTGNQIGLQSANQMSRLEQLLQSSRNSAKDEDVDGEDPGKNEMFGMLRNICSKVTKAREAEKKSNKTHQESGEEQETTTEDQNSQTNSQICEKSESVVNERTGDTDINKRLEEVEKRLEQHVCTQVKEAEERLKNHFDSRLSEMEEKICSKMEQILQLFHNNGRSTPS
ncbi:hypothetical protein FSP39_010787 [Pinctada imbricata]|uniref:Uncharacterized protein n=1 Tax=Pinctada imbricata TaxID=66713 RepID=A0AA89BYG6_PINIB|nr:hypothetical protein FSP39_010787 [Pinctada imbricata]